MELQLETESSQLLTEYPFLQTTPYNTMDTPHGHTPSEEHKHLQALPFWEEGDGEECVKVEALYQQPRIVGHDAVLEEDHDQLAAHLEETGM